MKYPYVLRKWTPENGDKDMVYSDNLSSLDQMAVDLNEMNAGDDSVHYHAEEVKTPPMQPHKEIDNAAS